MYVLALLHLMRPKTPVIKIQTERETYSVVLQYPTDVTSSPTIVTFRFYFSSSEP
jgi:hypothetical protein